MIVLSSVVRIHKSLIAGASSLALGLASGAVQAQSFTVQNGQTVGPQIMNNAGDTGVVEAGGTIDTSTSHGVHMNNVGQSLTNNGTITTTGFTDDGVLSTSDNNTITNTGSISTTGNSSEGIDSDSFSTIKNSGTVSTTGTNSEGLETRDNSTIINSGSVITTGNFSDGIFARHNSTVINSGLVKSTGTGAQAIYLFGNDVTKPSELILNPGSVIIGPINFQTSTNTLTIGNGLSIANTHSVNLPGTINASGAPSAVNGMQVAVADPTNLAAQDEFLSDLTGGIFGTVRNRLGTMRTSESSAGQVIGALGLQANSAPMTVSETTAALRYGAMTQDSYNQGWAQAFGSYRRQGASGPAVATDIMVGGLVSGFDEMIDANTRAGFFFGGAAGKVEADFDSQETDVNTLFGGLYASKQMGGTAVDFAVTVGFSTYDRERQVANNTVATGLETARADYDGWFISPELTLAQPVTLGGQRVEASVTVRYSGLFLDGFTESGASDALTVDDRQVHVFQARTQLTMPSQRATDDGGMVRDAWYIGLEGRAQVGDKDITGTLLAQNITFNPGGDSETAGVFAGYQLEQTSANGTTYYAGIEGQVETGGNYQASGKAGVKFRF